MMPAPCGKVAGLAGDRDFAGGRARCQAAGGAVCEDDLACWLAERRRADAVSLTDLIVSGHIFGFEWQGNFWVPMFQFELGDLSIRQVPRTVRAELGSVFDGWALAVWFVQPCAWLSGQSPLDLMEADLPAVLEAARSERFVATAWAGKPGASFTIAPPASSALALRGADPVALGAPASVSCLECTAILHRLGHMGKLYGLRPRQVRNGSCHLQAPVNAAA